MTSSSTCGVSRTRFRPKETPAGPLELFDGPAYRGLLTLAAKAMHRDPEKVAARKARRAARKAARKG